MAAHFLKSKKGQVYWQDLMQSMMIIYEMERMVLLYFVNPKNRDK